LFWGFGMSVQFWIDSATLGLAGPVSSASLCSAPPGVIGPPVFSLQVFTQPTGYMLSGTFAPSAAQLTDLGNGNWYLQVNTQAYPSGYLRGQVGPATLPATFGEGCRGSNGVRPQISAKGVPFLGANMFLNLNGALPNSFALFAFGASRDNSGPIPLPVALGTIGIGSPHSLPFLCADAT